MFAQDWEPVVFKKKKLEDKPKGPSGALPHILREDPDEFRHKTVSKELSKVISSKRIKLGLTQDQLAQKLNMQPIVVRDIEACRGPRNSVAINKILNFLSSQSH